MSVQAGSAAASPSSPRPGGYDRHDAEGNRIGSTSFFRPAANERSRPTRIDLTVFQRTFAAVFKDDIIQQLRAAADAILKWMIHVTGGG
ncbi:MAG: hypothetical protein ACRYGP_33150 [Janthinobacterium lividum]